MNENLTWVGSWVKYCGKSRPHLTGTYKVLAENAYGAAQFDVGDGTDPQWCHKSCLRLVPAPRTTAQPSAREKLIAEIDSTKKRLIELEAALTVIDSLN